MRSLHRISMSAILATVAGIAASALTRMVDPSMHFIAVRCFGTAAFAGVLLGCLVVMTMQAGES